MATIFASDEIPPWNKLTAPALAGVLAFIALVAYVYGSNPSHWVAIVDDANLAFHEAGHPLFGIFGPTLGLYGGTLGQLVFPAVTTLTFWRRREPAAFALCLAWLCENFLNISRYMADARALALPLVGGGEHDWTAIFERWGYLPRDTAIAAVVATIARLGLLACVLWLTALFRRQRSNLRTSSDAI